MRESLKTAVTVSQENEMIKLMNSAMMPQEGTYLCTKISEQSFARWIRTHPFESFVGYEATAKHIEAISGVQVPVNRGETTLAPDDVMLVCRLNFRLADPKKKADRNYAPEREDYEYFYVEYLG